MGLSIYIFPILVIVILTSTISECGKKPVKCTPAREELDAAGLDSIKVIASNAFNDWTSCCPYFATFDWKDTKHEICQSKQTPCCSFRYLYEDQPEWHEVCRRAVNCTQSSACGDNGLFDCIDGKCNLKRA